uniref:Uncharacterized protein n=1 Tax=Periophthalmus magnuspinnatus TaxID=409849 RepID=A0A3B4AL57_9GOBI
MGATQLLVLLSVTMLHLVSMSFMTPEPDTPPTSSPDTYPPGELLHAALQSKEYLGTTTNPTQAVPRLRQSESTAAGLSPGMLTTSPSRQSGLRSSMSSLPVEEETTTTLITTTTITTMHAPQCNATLSAMEDVVESPDPGTVSPLECTYSITVYSGYGVEIQVKKVDLSRDESLTILTYGSQGLKFLADKAVMSEGQVIRSPTNQVFIHYKSRRQSNHGVFSLHYQYVLSCPFPRSPENGGVTVTDIHPGGQAHFHCDPGFQVRGHEVASCINATEPRWSTLEPQCVVSCGGWVRNATVGRILSPPPPTISNHSSGNNLSCHWLIEAKEGHRLHLHFERIALDEDEDLIVRSGNSSTSPSLFDSDADDVPERGLLSESSALYLELTADSSSIPLLLALRYEFDDEHCWEPYMPHGNFTSSDLSFQLGTTVSFTCSPGFVMEQGSSAIECVDPSNPHWNDTEPVCKLCGGDLTEPSGTILSPDWPQSYSKGLDCVWQIHGSEDKRIELDIHLNIRHMDVLTVFDGRDLMSHVIGQYLGSKERFQVVSGASEITIQFQSDPDDSSFILSQGFLIHYRAEVEPNDTCPTLPQIEFGWISSSHPSHVRGSVLTYTCLPGYDISGTDIITCQWDLSWSSSPPTCVKQQCPDPGEVVNGARSVRPEAGFAVGTVVRFSCNQGYQLEGPNQISCHGRDTGTPKWSDRSPKCVKYDPCPNPGVPDNGYQTLYKHSYQAGETLRFFCYEGYELIGEVIITCVPGHPSQWNSPPPFCKAYEELLEDHKLSQAFEPSHQILGENIALAIILPIILVILLIGGIYMYYTICRLEWKPLFWKSLSHTHSYSPITVESDFNNPLYEAGVSTEQ